MTQLAPKRFYAKNVLIYGLGSVAQTGLGFVLLPLLTDQLDSSEFGIYSLALTLTVFANTIFYLGMNSALTRSFFDFNDVENRNAIFTIGLIVTIFGALGVLLTGFWAGNQIAALLFSTSIDPPAEVIRWALYSCAGNIVNQYLLQYFRIKHRP